MVPVMASPTVPPTCWKKVRLLVAVPNRSTGTLFCTISVKTANVGPTPSPVMSMASQSIGMGVSPFIVLSRYSPTELVISAMKRSHR